MWPRRAPGRARKRRDRHAMRVNLEAGQPRVDIRTRERVRVYASVFVNALRAARSLLCAYVNRRVLEIHVERAWLAQLKWSKCNRLTIRSILSSKDRRCARIDP